MSPVMPASPETSEGAERAPPQASISDAHEIEAWERLLASLFRHVSEAARHVRTLASVSTEQARLRLRRARTRILWTLLFALVVATILVSGAVFFARGLAASLAVLFGQRAWLGELVAGLVLLALAGAGLALALAREERAELARLRRKYAHDERQERHGPERAEGEDDRGAAGAGASAQPESAAP